MRLPARVGRLEPLGEVRANVEPAVARPTAEPLDRAADREVHAERRDVERHDPGRLVGVEDHDRADLVRAPHDRLDVLDLRGLEEDVADRDEERALVDRVDDRRVVADDHHLEVGLRLPEVAHRREVRLLVHDAVAPALGPEARAHDRLGDGDVLVHHRRAGRRADDAADLVADHHRHRPPALAPRPDPARLPRPGVLREPVLRRRGHRAERVVDQIGRVRQDGEAVTIGEARSGMLRYETR